MVKITTDQSFDKQMARDLMQTLNVIRGMTPAEAEEWVQQNVTNLATAKSALSTIAAVLVALVRYVGLERDH